MFCVNYNSYISEHDIRGIHNRVNYKGLYILGPARCNGSPNSALWRDTI